MARRKLISAVLGALCATAFIAPAAQADDTLGVAACHLTGITSQTGNDSVNSLEHDLSLPGGFSDGPFLWLLDTDTGRFSFGGDALCAAVDVASTGVYGTGGGWAAVAAEQLEVAGEGTFSNLVCGTGTANGTATIRGPANLLGLGAAGTTDLDVTFLLRVTATVGVLEISITPGSDGTSAATDPNEIGPNVVTGGGGLGVIDLLPTGGSCVTGFGVSEFNLNGAFETSLSS